MPTEKEKMLAGDLYNATDPELTLERRRARQLLKQLNDSNDDEETLRKETLLKLIPEQGTGLWIEPPFYCDYGTNITLGNRVFFNFNCVVLDVARVSIGDRVLIGPAVQIYTAMHPLSWQDRAAGHEFGKPVHIGDDTWIGGGVVVCPGVTIGSRCIIGAGSVVTRDIPDDTFAVGNPCRPLRRLEQPYNGGTLNA